MEFLFSPFLFLLRGTQRLFFTYHFLFFFSPLFVPAITANTTYRVLYSIPYSKGFIYHYAEPYATAAGYYELYEVNQGDGPKTTTDHGCVCGCSEIILAARDLSHPSL